MATRAMRKGLMRYFSSFITLFFVISNANSSDFSLEKMPLKKSIKENILKGEVFSESKVENTGDGELSQQSLNFVIAGLHPKSCDYALKKLSLYEEYSKYIDFVKVSNYDDSKQEIDFLLDHTLLPYRIQLIFKLPRVKTIGNYPFKFEIGILKDLKGMIYISRHKERCLFYTTADWIGPHTKIPNFILEIFSQTLSKISMEMLFRISSNLSK